jgi:hypothetical protein
LGDPAHVPVSGNRRKAAPFGTINIGTGRYCVEAIERWNGLSWRDHLRRIRTSWRGWDIVLFLDRGSPHTAQASCELAFNMGIELRWLPTACPELTPVESIWRWLKGTVLCNFQPTNFSETIKTAVEAVKELAPRQILAKAGVLSKNFWLRTYPNGKRILEFFKELESSPHAEVREAVGSDKKGRVFGGEFGFGHPADGFRRGGGGERRGSGSGGSFGGRRF